jgi:hypothetical protein
MTTEEMLVKILAKLEEMNAQWHNPAEQPTPSSPPSTSILTADTEEREASAPTISTKPAMTSSASLMPSPTSAPPQDVDPSFQSGADCLSRLPDSLLRNIVSRLPIKDAAHTAVLSHRWSLIWRAAPLLTLDDFHR